MSAFALSHTPQNTGNKAHNIQLEAATTPQAECRLLQLMCNIHSNPTNTQTATHASPSSPRTILYQSGDPAVTNYPLSVRPTGCRVLCSSLFWARRSTQLARLQSTCLAPRTALCLAAEMAPVKALDCRSCSCDSETPSPTPKAQHQTHRPISVDPAPQCK